jgi:hypothetical protein
LSPAFNQLQLEKKKKELNLNKTELRNQNLSWKITYFSCAFRKSNKSNFGEKKKRFKSPSKKATLVRGERRQAIRTTKLGSHGIFEGLLEGWVRRTML